MQRRAKQLTLTASTGGGLSFGCLTGKIGICHPENDSEKKIFVLNEYIPKHLILSRGYDDITGTLNVTYFGDESPFELTTVWRKNNPKSSQRPFCIATRLGES